MTKRQQNREARRARILDAASACFAQAGFHGAGMADIAAASEVTPANLYRYFAGKEEIVCAIVDQQREAVAVAVGKALAEADAVEALAGLLGYFMTVAREPANSRLWLEILAEVARNERVRTAFMVDDALVTAGFGDLLRRGIADGAIAADLDVDATVVWLIALIDGAVGRMVIEPDFDLARATASFIGLVRRALKPSV